MVSHKGAKVEHKYLRYGVDNGVEPLIFDRNFHRLRDDYREISEEFRLFHDLYHERKTGQYIKIDEDGNEEIVAVIEPNHVQIPTQRNSPIFSDQGDASLHSIHF